ncbi:MAG TPA: SRPBCC family protein [Rhodocyclaceae bacterium]
MEFEHLVEINDPGNPLIEALSRDQVWSGLMHRVEDARPFLPGLDDCVILARHADGVERSLRFGQAEIRDSVRYLAGFWVSFETPAADDHGGGLLTIRIEEPAAGHLFLRFTYRTVFATGHEQEDAAFSDYLRQAYEAADIDTVRIIRLLAADIPH